MTTETTTEVVTTEPVAQTATTEAAALAAEAVQESAAASAEAETATETAIDAQAAAEAVAQEQQIIEQEIRRVEEWQNQLTTDVANLTAQLQGQAEALASLAQLVETIAAHLTRPASPNADADATPATVTVSDALPSEPAAAVTEEVTAAAEAEKAAARKARTWI